MDSLADLKSMTITGPSPARPQASCSEPRHTQATISSPILTLAIKRSCRVDISAGSVGGTWAGVLND